MLILLIGGTRFGIEFSLTNETIQVAPAQVQHMAIHEWAFEIDSDVFVHANDAIKSKPYRCTGKYCGQEVRRRAGSFEPHFYHLSDELGMSCGGGEGPRHRNAKEKIAKWFRENNTFKTVLVEQRVGRFIVDILIQTDYGPFYLEIIDTHEPEEENWSELDGRIIPFWITTMDEVFLEEGVIDHVLKLLKCHFDAIGDRVTNLKHYELKRFNFSFEDIWYHQRLTGIFHFVQELHRTLHSRPHNYPEPLYFRESEMKESYKLAAKRLRYEMKKE
jgi:hypothetical protein